MIYFRRTCILGGLACKKAHDCFSNMSISWSLCPAKQVCEDTTARKLMVSVSSSLSPAVQRANFTFTFW